MRKKDADKLVRILRQNGIDPIIYKVRRGYWLLAFKFNETFFQLVEY